MTGTLTAEAANLTALNELSINNAEGITGSIPPELGNLAALEHVVGQSLFNALYE